VLRGRRIECEALDRLVDEVRAGRSGVVVMRGEAGIGKSALLEYVAERGTGCRVMQAAGVQAEMELAFAGVHQLCGPLLDRLGRLPAPQRAALQTAFGMSGGEPPDRFFVGLAVLNLLSEAAEEIPLLCLVDDAQWLDRSSVQTLAFVARRLLAESVGAVFTTREDDGAPELRGLPTLAIDGLAERDARALLESALPGPIDRRVLDRVVAETDGNPLALLELPHDLTAAELAGGFGLPGALSLSRRIEESFRRRLARLPRDTRLLLLVAAAEPAGDAGLVWRASKRIGVGADTAEPAETAGLLELSPQLRFRHPLVRSAVYRAAPAEDRRAAHRALAAVTDRAVDRDRRAWHLASAALGPDEDIAAELERSAGRAQARGGLAAAAAFLERASALTVDPALRARRGLAAARAKHEAGAPEAALKLLAASEDGLDDEVDLARVDMLRAQIAFAVRRGGDAPPLLLKAARRLEPLDVALAREAYLSAFSAALFAGRLAGRVGLVEVGQAARSAPASSQSPTSSDLLLDGLALLVTDGYPAGAPTVGRALDGFVGEYRSGRHGTRLPWLPGHVAMVLWDDASWDALSASEVRLARRTGALTVLPLALRSRVGVHLLAGEVASAASLVEEIETLAEATESHAVAYGVLVLAAWRGREDTARTLIERATADVVPRGEGLGLAITQWASAVLHNGLGRYELALAAAQDVGDDPRELLFSTWATHELIEAAMRSGRTDLAAPALRRLSERARAVGTDWALGIEARSRALVSDDEHAEALYREAIRRLARTRIRVELARAHLLYGEWLRRQRRRLDAREQLRTAHEMLMRMGIDAFAQRAARELQATGETARKRDVETRDQLTPQEAQIARLARDGLSNPEIGALLFISPRTVQYHLRKVFVKLDITSRHELDRALADAASD
jgi:DNA-binding CsgD family transcriptional regulator